MFDPTSLSPLGISLLLWLLLPCAENVTFVRNVMEMSRLNNCLIHFVTDREGFGGDPCKIFLRFGWTYWLNDPDYYLKEHVVIGDYGVLFGNCLSTFVSIAKQIWNAMMPRPSPAMALVDGSTVGTPISYDQSTASATLSDDGHGEYLYLHPTTKKLFYQPNISTQTVITSVNAQASFMGLKVTVNIETGLTPGSEQNATDVMSGSVTWIEDLEQFLLIEMRGMQQKQRCIRMKWLGRLLRSKGIFPLGHNQQFLKLATGMSDGPYILKKIFETDDCMVSKMALRSWGVRERDSQGGKEILFIGRHGVSSYQATCEEVGDMYRVTSIQEMNISPEAIAKTFREAQVVSKGLV